MTAMGDIDGAIQCYIRDPDEQQHDHKADYTDLYTLHCGLLRLFHRVPLWVIIAAIGLPVQPVRSGLILPGHGGQSF